MRLRQIKTSDCTEPPANRLRSRIPSLSFGKCPVARDTDYWSFWILLSFKASYS